MNFSLQDIKENCTFSIYGYPGCKYESFRDTNEEAVQQWGASETGSRIIRVEENAVLNYHISTMKGQSGAGVVCEDN